MINSQLVWALQEATGALTSILQAREYALGCSCEDDECPASEAAAEGLEPDFTTAEEALASLVHSLTFAMAPVSSLDLLGEKPNDT